MIRSIFLSVLLCTPTVFAQPLSESDEAPVEQKRSPHESAPAVGDADQDNEQSAGNELDPFFEVAPIPKLADELNFRWKLSSGETIDVEKTFREPFEELMSRLERRRRGKPASLIQIQSTGDESPRVIISRRGKTLDGPFASFSKDGTLAALVGYQQGKRNGISMTWDPSHRPLVFAQYRQGKLDGIRCLFTACCDSCKSGHLWLVQEWKAGELQRSHIVGAPQNMEDTSGNSVRSESEFRESDSSRPDTETRPTGNPIVTVDARYQALGGTPPELREAMGLLSDFESQFNRDEVDLKRFVTKRYIQERKAIVMRSNAASQANIAWLKQAYPQTPIFSGTGGVTLSGFV